jgi:YesN/AraC family two-component response regulator
MVIRPARKLRSAEREEITNASLVPDEYAYAVEMMYKDYLAVLVNIKDDCSHRACMAEKICETITGFCGQYPSVGVGNIYKSISEINNSFTEAVIALESRGNDAGDSIIFYDSIKFYHEIDSMSLIQSHMLKLAEWLRQRNHKMVDKIIAELYESVYSMTTVKDFASARFMADLLLCSLMPVAQDAHLGNISVRVSSLIHSTTFEKFFKGFADLCRDIMDVFEAQIKELQTNQYEKILNYIEENYLNEEISLTSIAEIFDMTPSYLSRFFREKTGTNFIDYLSEKRMSEACRLLTESTLKIKEIMEHVGYIDIASFSRKFKQVTGMSPGKYRENIRITGGFPKELSNP